MHSGALMMLAPEGHVQEAIPINEQGWHSESPTISPSRDIRTHLYLPVVISMLQGSYFPAGQGKIPPNPLSG